MDERTSTMPQGEKDPWLELVREAWSESTTYIDNNYRPKWDDGIKHFLSQHTGDSKYVKKAYKYRSKIFRPKTRAAIRGNEAAAVAAFFANQDVITTEPQDQSNPVQVAAADLMEEVLNYRLQNTVPWFQVCVGGVQDAQVVGVVASYQYWEYEERVSSVKETWEDDLGDEQSTEYEESEVLKDGPCVELIPVENIRIHPAADWLSPIQSSPYVIRAVPMWMQDVKARMKESNPKTGEPKWIKRDDAEITQSQKYLDDVTRLAREDREDPFDRDEAPPLKNYDIVWCLENFVKKDGKDYVFWTLGVEYLLTKPVPIEEVYWHGERPIVMGCCILEAHKLYPSGLAELGKPLQKELNENVNQRTDNVKLVMNKRYIGRRGANIDFDSLLRNVAGSVTLADDVAGDIRELEFNDVTGSSYQEQDRLNVDFDELVGAFSTGSVQTNRKLNETVRGMAMIKGGANSLTEYLLRTLSETWLEPVMKQLVKLEQAYETDEVVLALAADRAKLWQKHGINQATDWLLKQNLTVKINIGMGATDPMTRVQSFAMGIQVISDMLKNAPPGVLNVEEVAKEIFGRLGYKDGARFLVGGGGEQQDPEKMQMAQMLQQMQQMIMQLQGEVEEKQSEQQVKVALGAMKEEGQDRRAVLDAKTRLIEERMDLANPVVGEKVSRG